MLHLLPSLQLLHLLNHLLLLLFRRQSLLFTCHLLLSTKIKQRSGCHLFCLAHLVLLPLCCCLPDFAPVSIISISSIIIIAQALQSAPLKPTTTFWNPTQKVSCFWRWSLATSGVVQTLVELSGGDRCVPPVHQIVRRFGAGLAAFFPSISPFLRLLLLLLRLILLSFKYLPVVSIFSLFSSSFFIVHCAECASLPLALPPHCLHFDFVQRQQQRQQQLIVVALTGAPNYICSKSKKQQKGLKLSKQANNCN